jgi:hypothetical protein
MRASLVLLPAIAYGLLTLSFYRRAGSRDIPEALVKAHLVIFAFIAVSTEALSAIHAMAFPILLTAWLLFLLVCVVTAAVLLHRKSQGFSFPVLRTVTPLTAVLVGVLAFILATTLATALLYPPNTWDSMTYHMSRVAHWISSSNISFYPTAIPRQNYQMPLAEFAIMHMQLLTGGDWYANLVQWVSFLVLVCLGPLTAVELGLSKRQQLIAAMVIATLPMAILQASSTQNDLVVSSFVMSFGLFMLRMRQHLSAENVLLAAMALGLALLTKATALLYCAAIGTSLAVPVLLASRSDRARFLRVTAAIVCMILVTLALNAGHFLRNYALYGLPFSIDAEYYRNDDMSAAALVGNTVRNGALHLGTPSRRINGYLYHALQVVLGAQLNNPKTTWPGRTFAVPYSLHEDSAGNLMHMLIVLCSIVYLPISWWQHRHTRAPWYAVGTMLGAVLYCWILKWQPWASRLHTPLFAMAAPLLAITIASEIGRVKKRIGSVMVLCLVLYSLPFTLANQSRSLVSLEWNRKDRLELYFQNRRDLLRGYKNAIHVVHEASTQDVGLYLGRNDWEYPFWVLALQERNGKALTFRHVGVSNLSRTIYQDEVLPVYVIATRNIENWKHAGKYTAIYTSGHVSVFMKSEH